MDHDDPRWPVSCRSSRIHGLGSFAETAIPARRLVGRISGILRPLPAARRAQSLRTVIKLVEISRRWALDCTEGNILSNLNHCCEPNCRLRIHRRRVEVWTLQPIPAGSELTVDYGATQHPDGMACACGAKACRSRL